VKQLTQWCSEYV